SITLSPHFTLLSIRPPPRPTPFPYTTLFRSQFERNVALQHSVGVMTEWLSANEVRRRLPLLDLPDVLAGTFYGRDGQRQATPHLDRKSTRLNSSHVAISYAVFCLKKKKRMLD